MTALCWARDAQVAAPERQSIRIKAVLAHHTEKRTLEELARQWGVTKRAVSKWVAAFRLGGVRALMGNGAAGRRPTLSADEIDGLKAVLRQHPAMKEAAVKVWLVNHLGREVTLGCARYWRVAALDGMGVRRSKRCRVTRFKPRTR